VNWADARSLFGSLTLWVVQSPFWLLNPPVPDSVKRDYLHTQNPTPTPKTAALYKKRRLCTIQTTVLHKNGGSAQNAASAQSKMWLLCTKI
jgi:hypothetical protein